MVTYWSSAGCIFGDDSGMKLTPSAPPPAQHAPLQVALIGYGGAGRIFHAPLIAGVPGLQLACIVTRQSEAVQRDWPAVRCEASASAALADPRH